jgi:hypothetical protein
MTGQPIVKLFVLPVSIETILMVGTKFILIIKMLQPLRHSGRDYRNPEGRTVRSLPSMALGARIPASMTIFFGLAEAAC